MASNVDKSVLPLLEHLEADDGAGTTAMKCNLRKVTSWDDFEDTSKRWQVGMTLKVLQKGEIWKSTPRGQCLSKDS